MLEAKKVKKTISEKTKKSGEFKRFFCWLPRKLHGQIKSQAALENLYMDDLAVKVFSEYLQNHRGDRE